MTLAIEVNNLHKIYNPHSSNRKLALQDLNLKIAKGSFTGLLGPNGAGKSTFINILGNIVNRTSGNIKIMGHDLFKKSHEAKKKLGIVPQEINLDPFFTPLEALMIQQGLYGIRPNKKTCLDLLKFVHLEDKSCSRVRSLSGGMKRRVLIAKALIHKPDVVILDEPTAGVDLNLRARIWEAIKELHKSGTTIILTTHYLEEAEALCDNIAIIDKGKLIAQENTNTLISSVGSKTLIVTTDNICQIPASLKKLTSKTESNKIFFFYKEDNENGFIINELYKNNINIVSVNVEKTSLEDVFVKLTG